MYMGTIGHTRRRSCLPVVSGTATIINTVAIDGWGLLSQALVTGYRF